MRGGIEAGHLDLLASEAMKQQRLLINNPCPIGQHQARALYEAVLWAASRCGRGPPIPISARLNSFACSVAPTAGSAHFHMSRNVY